MIRQQLVYPHRLSLINNGICGVCGEKKSENFIHVNKNSYIGIQTCKNDNCKSLGLEWMKTSVITIENLRKEFSDDFYVIRSSGKKESGWEIHGNAYRDEYESPFWVFVRHEKRRQTKCISIDKLRLWNK